MNETLINPQEKRIMELAQRIVNTFSPPELAKLTNINPQTIQRWADGIHRPSKNTSATIPSIIAVSDQDFADYLEGNLDLDQLWDKRGTAKRILPKTEITLQSVLNDAKLLSTMERLKLMSSLFLTLSPQEIEQSTIKPIPLVELSDTAKKRLGTLLLMSVALKKTTIQSVIEQIPQHKGFIEELIEGLENDYTVNSFEALLPHLCYQETWVNDSPVITDSSKSFDSVQSLIDSLECG